MRISDWSSDVCSSYLFVKHSIHAWLPSVATRFKELDNIGRIAYGHLNLWACLRWASTAWPQGGQLGIAKRRVVSVLQGSGRNRGVFRITWAYQFAKHNSQTPAGWLCVEIGRAHV